MSRVKKCFAILLVMALTLTLAPTTALALDIQAGTPPTLARNSGIVGFAGQEWWVIGDSGNGVWQQPNSLTLLVKGGNPYGSLYFRNGRENSAYGYSKYYNGLEDWYYANNPSGTTNWSRPNEYRGSTLQQKMESIANGIPAKERAMINARTLRTAEDNSQHKMTGGEVANQKLWPLSMNEWYTINNSTIRSFGTTWWLRAAYDEYGDDAYYGKSAGNEIDYYYVDYGATRAARPAFSLNLSSVIFTSAASGPAAKSAVSAGSGFAPVSAPSGTMKFTAQSSAQTLTVTATEAQTGQSGATLAFRYRNATTGSNQYVSAVLTDNNENGALKYYGKLANSSGAASGDLSIPLFGVTDGTYTLKIFSEETNGDNYTDFCSAPIEMTVEVTGGTGTVSDFTGADTSLDAGLSAVAGQTISPGGESGTKGDPITAAVTVPYGKASIADADLTPAGAYATAKLYDSTFSSPASSTTLASGGAGNADTHIYVKVTAEDASTTSYYKITVTRAADDRKTVSFGGKEWLVIGDGTSGVAPAAGTLTMLSKNHVFGSSRFNMDFSSRYNGSTLQEAMGTALTDLNLSSAERGLIQTRTLTGYGYDYDSEMSGEDAANQKFWPLSSGEYNALPSDFYRAYGDDWWLRSPRYDWYAFYGRASGDGTGYGDVYFEYRAIRPAFHLDLTSVLFTSAATGGKSDSTGDSLSAIAPPASFYKFTVESDSIAPAFAPGDVSNANGTLTVNYTGAAYANGETRTVSAIVKDGGGNVSYYGKLKDITCEDDENGVATITLPDGFDPTNDTLYIFVEQHNGDNYTDFAGTPRVVVSNDASLMSVAGQTVTATGDGTAIATPVTAAITVSDSVDSIAPDDIAATTGATAELYSDALFSQNKNLPISLTASDGNHLYIKVTAEDSVTIVYYDVTVTRRFQDGGDGSDTGIDADTGTDTDTDIDTDAGTSEELAPQPVTVNITYDTNGGKAVNPRYRVAAKGSGYGAHPKVSRKGYTFKGWYTAKTGGAKVTEKTVVTMGKDHTLYARWTANKYKVKLNTNGGKLSASAKSKAVKYGAKIGNLPKPTRTHYNFKGWYTKKKGGARVTATTTNKTVANRTLYAHWAKQKRYGELVDAAALRIRENPSSHAKAVGYLQKGQTFKTESFIDNPGKSNDWYSFNYKGKTAYVYAKYVKTVWR
jgi:uncharacterized repeat protein (TIGR02543 family)